MPKKAISIKMDEDLKRDTEKVLKSMGLNMSTAINLFARQVVNRGYIPFEIKAAYVPNAETRKILDDVKAGKNLVGPFKSTKEMTELFADIPEAITNTIEIAKRCNLQLTLNQVFLPNYPVSQGLTTEETLCHAAEQGLEKKWPSILKDCPAEQIAAKRQQYTERLQTELAVINKMGFAGYFLIVADFIGWAHANKIPVGPGRGSGAGSMVAYALEITVPDPLQYGLLFERFLNPERVSMPDFDIDFCMEGRDRVIEYVHNRYGKEAVSQIITFGTMAAKAVIRDVGRALGHPYGFVDQIAKLIPMELGMTLSKALQQEEALQLRYKKEEEVKALIDLAQKLEGITRNVGTHAGGVVIAPSKLTDYTPMYREDDALAQPITQFDKYDVEAIGLVKFDFLGLRTLTIIDWTLQNINAERLANGETIINLNTIALSDPKTYLLLRECKTTAVFQLESRGMRDLMRRLEPDSFEDIIALVALFRPGPLQSGMVDDFINRKKGLAAIKYLHPKLAPILQATYGVILYQEQVMRIAQDLAGYTLGAADGLRSAMGKKKPKEMAKQRKIFIDGSIKNGIAAEIAENIFNLMEKFAGYGFNKSHSVAYALIAYQTAWLKAHFPAEFMAAVLSADLSNTDKIVVFINDCKALNLKIIAPSVNLSAYKFIATQNDTIIYGLGAIKGVGENAIAAIIAARLEKPFQDLFDFCARIDLRKANKRVLEALINAGALDCLGLHRAALMSNLDQAIHAAEQMHKNLSFGQADLFGSTITAAELTTPQEMTNVPVWSTQIRLSKEKAVLGLYLTGHPIETYLAELHRIGITQIIDLKPTGNQQCKIAGFITSIRTRPTKKGDRMAFLTLDDGTGQQDLAVFADLLQKNQELLKQDNFIVVEGMVAVDTYTDGYRLNVKDIATLAQIRAKFAKRLEITIDTAFNSDNKVVQAIQKVLQTQPTGMCPIVINYKIAAAVAKINLGREWLVIPTDELISEIIACGKAINAEFIYIS